jgi:integrase
MESKIRLTEIAVELLQPDGRDVLYLDSLLAGFGVRVTPTGTKLFVARARVAGKPVRVTVGRHPGMSVAEARREARNALDAMRAGKNPAAEKKARVKAAAAKATTVEQFADRWLAEYVRPKLKALTIRDYDTIVEKTIKPRFGLRPIGDIEKADMTALHADMAKTPRRANYVLAVMRSMFTYAEEMGLRPANSNPAKKIKLYRENAKERYLDEKEIARAADAIAKCEEDAKIGPYAAAGLRLALLTGMRSGEVSAVEWRHINFARRWIRLPDSKTGAKTIHLSPAAMEVIRGVPKTNNRFLIIGAEPDTSYARLGNAWIKVRRVAGLEDVRLHDLRHTFASIAAANGMSLPMIGRLLGHKVAATTQRYAHLAQDVATEANDVIGAAIGKAMTKEATSRSDIVGLRAKKKASVR